jgi:AcrR family transcriptional regulator
MSTGDLEMQSQTTEKPKDSGPGGNLAGPPRDRILAVARDLFYRHGIHAVGVDAIAEAAGTNKMTLYRHFGSKDVLIAECLALHVVEIDAAWDETARQHAGKPLDQLHAWMRYVGAFKLQQAERGCAFINAAAELPDKNHPARRVIEQHKSAFRQRSIELCESAGLIEPELLADKAFLLCEGARASIQSIGPNGPASRLPEMLDRLIADHTPSKA